MSQSLNTSVVNSMIKRETREFFITPDGGEFASLDNAIDYMRNKIEAVDNAARTLDHYVVSHMFDREEGKGYFALTHILADVPMPLVLQYCFSRYGHSLRKWYGSPILRGR